MRTHIYNAIEIALQDLPIAHVGLWNQQLAYAQQEQPFGLPAVLIEFANIEWKPLLHGVREAVVDIDMHVLLDSRVGLYADVLPRLGLLDAMNSALHGLKIERHELVLDALTLMRSASAPGFDDLWEQVETYRAHVVVY